MDFGPGCTRQNFQKMAAIKTLQRIYPVYDENSPPLDLSLVTAHEYKAHSMNSMEKDHTEKFL